MLFDTHAHYNDRQFADDLHELMSQMEKNNVGLIMNPATKASEFEEVVAMCDKYPFMYGAVGVHPEEVDTVDDTLADSIRKYAMHPKIKAIGEIGLDYYWVQDNKEKQKALLAMQIERAKELRLPVIIHDREAHGDMMSLLREHKVWECGGVFHCYSGSAQMVREIVDWGMYVGFGGVLTFKNAIKPCEAAAAVPIDRLLVETDAPYMAPVPMRGKRNSSIYVHYVVEKLAQIKGIEAEEMEKICFENGRRVYNI